MPRRALAVGIALSIALIGLVAAYNLPAPANWDSATVILEAPYVDTPYLVKMPDVLATVVTVNHAEREGRGGQHVAIVRSADDGRTWGKPIEIEDPGVRNSAWGLPYYDQQNDLLYVFYAYNRDGLDKVGRSARVDCVGVIAYRTSSDRGLTWSERTELEVPATDIDARNVLAGEHKLFWLFDVPKFKDGHLYLGLSKISSMKFSETEAFFARVSIPPSSIELLPNGPNGVIADSTFGATHITEEPSILLHDDGLITMIARTDRGRLVEAWSQDSGKTFTVDWAQIEDESTYLLNPRGPASVWTLPDGRHLLWYYNNIGEGTKFSAQRNPVWYRFGERVGDRVRWSSEVRTLATASNPGARIGYASMVIVGEEILFSASDKGTAHGGTGAKLIRMPLSDLD